MCAMTLRAQAKSGDLPAFILDSVSDGTYDQVIETFHIA